MVDLNGLKKTLALMEADNMEQISMLVSRDWIRTVIAALERLEHGKWDEFGYCTLCGYPRQFRDDRYCGNCGVRMDGGEQE